MGNITLSVLTPKPFLHTRHLGITYGRGGDSAHLHEGMQKSGSEAARDYAGRREAREVAERIAGLQGWSDASWEAFAPSITGHIGSSHTQGQPALVKQGSEAYLAAV